MYIYCKICTDIKNIPRKLHYHIGIYVLPTLIYVVVLYYEHSIQIPTYSEYLTWYVKKDCQIKKLRHIKM